MDFGKAEDVQSVDFLLPPDHPATRLVLSGAKGKEQPVQVAIGCPTWANRAWIGTYFPAGAAEKDLLLWYARQFNTIELNTTHYRIPDEATVRRWREAVPPGFTFCPKVPQEISHHRLLQNDQELTAAFCASLLELGENLGVSFLQLPPTFGPQQVEILERFLLRFPRQVPRAVEFRHPDWFGAEDRARVGFELLEALGVSVVLTDVAGRRDVLHQRLTTPVAFIRFVGNSLHPSDYTRIDDWVARLQGWVAGGLQRIFYFLHQPDITHTPVLARYLTEKLNQACGLQLPPCQPIPQPVQGKLF
ncbi:DUF72 domain-containing protein [soil metagenome]